jgi:hypothetical protein
MIAGSPGRARPDRSNMSDLYRHPEEYDLEHLGRQRGRRVLCVAGAEAPIQKGP